MLSLMAHLLLSTLPPDRGFPENNDTNTPPPPRRQHKPKCTPNRPLASFNVGALNFNVETNVTNYLVLFSVCLFHIKCPSPPALSFLEINREI